VSRSSYYRRRKSTGAVQVDGEIEAGYHTAVFDGSRYASGIYFVRMTAQGSDAKPYVKTMKIVLMK
jgi:hypothetical protein